MDRYKMTIVTPKHYETGETLDPRIEAVQDPEGPWVLWKDVAEELEEER